MEVCTQVIKCFDQHLVSTCCPFLFCTLLLPVSAHILGVEKWEYLLLLGDHFHQHSRKWHLDLSFVNPKDCSYPIKKGEFTQTEWKPQSRSSDLIWSKASTVTRQLHEQIRKMLEQQWDKSLTSHQSKASRKYHLLLDQLITGERRKKNNSKF